MGLFPPTAAPFSFDFLVGVAVMHFLATPDFHVRARVNVCVCVCGGGGGGGGGGLHIVLVCVQAL